MSSEARDRVKVEKLLRLTTSSNEHEADNARQQAQRIMARYGWTPDDFEEDVSEVADLVVTPTRRELARIIALSRRCRTFANKHDIVFRGKKSAVESALALYTSLSGMCTLYCEIGPRDPGRDLHRHHFWRGFIDAIRERLQVMETSIPTPAADPEIHPRPQTQTQESQQERPNAPPRMTMADENRSAMHEFVQHVLPMDRARSVQWVIDNAYHGGFYLGQTVSIDPVVRRAAANRSLSSKNEEES